MATTREKCGHCGVLLLVSVEAQAVKCPRCRTVTMVTPTRAQPYEQLAQALEPVLNHAAERVRGFLGNMMPLNVNGYSSGYNIGSGGPYSYGGGYYGQPPPKPMLAPPSAYGMKRAVICGVTYRGKSYRTKGSINDAKSMKYFLTERFGFPSDSILMLTEEEIDPKRTPTKENIRSALRWLVQGCESGDSLVFYFSGHGSKQRDYNNDEADGFDETICPVDFETEGSIIDDEINKTIVRPLPKGAKLHAIIDACFSGTVLDLPLVCRMNREGYYWEDQISYAYKGTSGGIALSITACDDHQTCMETTALSGIATGALTYSLIQAVQSEAGLSYGRLLLAMRNVVHAAKSGGLRLNGPIAAMVNRALFNSTISQEPQLSSSEKFDIYNKQFVL